MGHAAPIVLQANASQIRLGMSKDFLTSVFCSSGHDTWTGTSIACFGVLAAVSVLVSLLDLVPLECLIISQPHSAFLFTSRFLGLT